MSGPLRALRHWVVVLLGSTLLLMACGIPGETRPHSLIGPEGPCCARPSTPTLARYASSCWSRRPVVPASGAPTTSSTASSTKLTARSSQLCHQGAQAKGVTEANVAEATHTVNDRRAGHFWDGEGLLLRARRLNRHWHDPDQTDPGTCLHAVSAHRL
jgi:hypothetical protein